jgi:D-inositol-3-phosphate glycosyltransferase
MKIALVAQNATPLNPRAGSGPESDDIGLGELSRKRADLSDGVRVEHIDAGPILEPAKGAEPADADLLDRVPAFSGPLRSSFELDRPDIVHALRWTSGLAALVAARDHHIPLVQEFNSLGVTDPRNRTGADGAAAARLRLEPAIGRSAAAVVATHSAEASDLANLGVHRSSIRVVPWGINTDLFTPEGPVAKRNGRPRLLTAADLTERPALETLLRALTKVPDAELVVVGGPASAQLDPEACADLARFASALGVADRVIFSGQVARAEMPALLRSADLVVSTCQYAPSGMTSLQAMACGTPVIAPPVDGHADAVVDGTTGILIPPGRPALLAQRIRQLLAHPMLLEAYGVAAVDRARSRYSWDRIATETLAVYDKAAAATAA